MTLQLAKYPPQKLYNAGFSNNNMVAWKPYLHSISNPTPLQAIKTVQFSPDRTEEADAGSWLLNTLNSFRPAAAGAAVTAR